MSDTPIGPNVKRLIAYRMAQLMIPDGTADPVVTGIRNIATPGKLAACGREATQWVQDALSVLTSAPDNPWGEDEEAMAGALIRRINARLQQRGLTGIGEPTL